MLPGEIELESKVVAPGSLLTFRTYAPSPCELVGVYLRPKRGENGVEWLLRRAQLGKFVLTIMPSPLFTHKPRRAPFPLHWWGDGQELLLELEHIGETPASAMLVVDLLFPDEYGGGDS